MDTIIIQIDQKDKAESLIQFLKSIDYIKSVEYLDKYLKFKERLEAVNKTAAETGFLDLTQEEIKDYRCREH